VEEVGPENETIIVLARSARARLSAAEGAAVRDTTGRTYAATTVALPSLQLSAIRAAIVMAVSGGADGLEAVGVVSGSDKPPPAEDLAAVRDLGGPTTPVYLATPDGHVWARIDAG
jgi:hypothetical protein